jgi:hypothetical protein
MATYSQSPGGTKIVMLDVPVRAYWSRPRAWHGEKVVMNVETAHLPDHTPFALRIREAEGGDGDVVDEKTGLELVNNRAAVPYAIRWDQASLGRKLELHGDRCEFFFEVKIDAPFVIARSNLLYVHLHPYVVSG